MAAGLSAILCPAPSGRIWPLSGSRYHLSIMGRPWTARAQSCRGCAPRWISRISTARVALALGAPLARLRRFDMILPLAGIAASAGPASYWSASTRPASASEYGVPEPFRDVPDDVFARREDALDWRHRLPVRGSRFGARPDPLRSAQLGRASNARFAGRSNLRARHGAHPGEPCRIDRRSARRS